MLDWSAEELATKCDMTREGITRLERGLSRPHRSTMEAIVGTLEASGIDFYDNGVRLHRDTFREIAPPNAYLKLLDDAFITLKDIGGAEVLLFYIDNELSSSEVIDSAIRMRRAGIRFRSLINSEKPYCLFPLAEYRGIPSALFHNNPIMVYADRVGAVIDPSVRTEEDKDSCFIIRNSSYAAAMRLMFESLWRTHKIPETTTATVTYE
jgi:transcriptional regulator with XRE-family HTH domain